MDEKAMLDDLLGEEAETPMPPGSNGGDAYLLDNHIPEVASQDAVEGHDFYIQNAKTTGIWNSDSGRSYLLFKWYGWYIVSHQEVRNKERLRNWL